MIAVEELVSLVLLAGELLLTCGAEMYRVEDTIERMGKAAGFVRVESFATPTGLFLSLHGPNGQVYTRVRRIRRSYNNLATIAEVNALSRAFSTGELTYLQVKGRLEELQERGAPESMLRNVVGGGTGLAFALMMGGSWLDGLIAGLVGTLIMMVVSVMAERVPQVLQAAVGSCAGAALVLFASRYLPLDVDVTILGAVMTLAPGVAVTTAIRDLMSGDLVAGLSRSAEALVVAVAIATGVAVVLSLGGR